MRFLIYSGLSEKNEFNEMIDFLENKRLILVDYFTDIDEAEYCLDIRKYDKIILFSSNNMTKYVNLLKVIKDSQSDAEVLLFGESSHSKIINFYIKDAILYKDISEIFNLFKETLPEEINYKNLIINTSKERKIWIVKDNIKKEISVLSKIDYFLLIYFLRHHEEKINIGRLIDAISEEPELTKSSIAETSISSIRKIFKNELDINPIKAFKKIGYRFSI